MSGLLWTFFLFLVVQRLCELVIARRNEKWMKERGGLERGEEHYKYFVFLHLLFFLSILTEVFLLKRIVIPFQPAFFIVFLLAQIARIWCIQSLGKFWNTKVIVLPDFPLVKRGPYRYIKHPNYIIVGIELFVIPLLFGAIITSVIFPFLHIVLIKYIRLPVEERALEEVMTNNRKEDSD